MNSSNGTLIPRRPLGGTGISLSVIGVGAEQAHANLIVAEFVERGVNCFDVAPVER